MAPSRSARRRLISILFTGLLCFVIVMQMLGATTSFWTLGLDSDLLLSSILEGLSLIPAHMTLPTVLDAQPYHEPAVCPPSVLLENMLFRPPDVPLPCALG